MGENNGTSGVQHFDVLIDKILIFRVFLPWKRYRTLSLMGVIAFKSDVFPFSLFFPSHTHSFPPNLISPSLEVFNTFVRSVVPSAVALSVKLLMPRRGCQMGVL